MRDYKIDGAGGVDRFIAEHPDKGCKFASHCIACPFTGCILTAKIHKKVDEMATVIRRLTK